MGLGNPGPRYEGTLHNAGYQVVDILLKQFAVVLRRKRFSSVLQAQIPGNENLYPMTLFRWMGYMNESGRAMSFIRKNRLFSIENLYIVVDNMDLETGICRLKTGGGSAGHNGLKSIISALGSPDFKRLYIGVGRPVPGTDATDHVIGPPPKTAAASMEQACQRAARALIDLRTEKFNRVAELLNRRES